MAGLALKAHQEPPSAGSEPERNIEQLCTDVGRFARFRAAMEDPEQIGFSQLMIVMNENISCSEQSGIRPWRMFLKVITTAAALLAVAISAEPIVEQPEQVVARMPLEPPPDRRLNRVPAAPTEVTKDPRGVRSADLVTVPSGPAVSFDFLTELKAMRPSEDTRKTSLITPPKTSDGWPSMREHNDYLDGLSERENSKDSNLTRRELRDTDYLAQIATLRHEYNIEAVINNFSVNYYNWDRRLAYYKSTEKIDGAILHIVYVGPFESERAAVSMCQEMRRHGDDCIIPAPARAGLRPSISAVVPGEQEHAHVR